jgi:hypothetical protein
MRVFLDANVLFSAAKSSGAVRQFLHKLKSLGHALVADGYVTSEAVRNLEAKFSPVMEDFEQVLEAVATSATASKPLGTEVAPGLPEKDLPVLACGHPAPVPSHANRRQSAFRAALRPDSRRASDSFARELRRHTQNTMKLKSKQQACSFPNCTLGNNPAKLTFHLLCAIFSA